MIPQFLVSFLFHYQQKPGSLFTGESKTERFFFLGVHNIMESTVIRKRNKNRRKKKRWLTYWVSNVKILGASSTLDSTLSGSHTFILMQESDPSDRKLELCKVTKTVFVYIFRARREDITFTKCNEGQDAAKWII